MSEELHNTGLSWLPREPFDRLSKPFAHFVQVQAAAGLVLLIFTITAILLSNSRWSDSFLGLWEVPVGIQFGSFELWRPLREWINDGLMTFFFFLVALELKRELVLGELQHPRMAALSIAGALGGMLAPAGVYLALQSGLPGADGWGTVMATDTAFVMGCLALLGSRIPQSLRVFMLSLAIVDDIGAILVLAIGYSSGVDWNSLALATLGFAGVWGAASLGVRSIVFYFLAGFAIWFAMDMSGVHGTITGVILGLLTPTRRWVSDERLHAIMDRALAYRPGENPAGNTDDVKALRLAATAAREALSPVERLELMLGSWIGFAVMPLFAFANAGVPLAFDDLHNPVTGAVFLGFALGKPIGVIAFTWIAVRFGIATRPKDLSWGLLAGGGMLAGIGFTMALFIANLAFDERLINAVKLGIFSASAFSAVAGITVLAWLSRGRMP